MPARRTYSRLSRLVFALACLFAAAGSWAWLGTQPVRGFETGFYRNWEKVLGSGAPESKPVLLGSKMTMPMEKAPHCVLQQHYPEAACVMLGEEEVAAHFHKAPIQPLDFAVLLNAARKAGFTCLGISSPLGWKGPCDPLVQETLKRTLQAFPACVLGMRGRMASRPEFTPAELAGRALDAARIEGSIAFLPSANASLPNSLAEWGGNAFAPWAIDWVEGDRLMAEGRDGGASYPLLVRWHGDIYPTLPLQLMMLAEGIQPGEISVEVGSHIAWRNSRLPLDSYGRTTLTEGCKVRTVTLTELMEGSREAADSKGNAASRASAGGDEARYLLLCEPVVSQPGEAGRAEWMAATLSQLACRTTERTEWTMRPVAGRGLYRVQEGHTALALALGVGLLFLLVAPGRSRTLHWVAEVAVLLLGLGALGSLIDGGHWVPVAPWLAALLVLFAGGRVLRFRQVRRRR